MYSSIKGDYQVPLKHKKLDFELLLETYDVLGVEKGKSKPILINGIENKKLQATYEDGEPCEYIMVNGVYEVYDLQALDQIEYDRYYPARGYYKKIK